MTLPKWTYLVVFGLGIFICWYFMKGCQQDNQGSVESIQVLSHSNDSFLIESQRGKRRYDSLFISKVIGDSAFNHKIDSQNHVIARLQGNVDRGKDSIRVMYANLKTFWLNHDTVALVDTYNRLNDQLTEVNNELFAVQLARDSADNIRIAEIQRLQGVITELQAQIKQLQEILVACTDNGSKLAKEGLKAAKRSKVNALMAKIGAGLSVVLALILIAHK